ncbi:MAG: DMT family transporter [Gemmatimonadaceae bacterium]
MTSTLQRAPVTPGRARESARPGVWLTDALLFTMALVWGVNYSVVKYGVRFFAPLAFNAVRVALAAAALLVIAGLAVREPWPSRRDTLRLLALGVLGNCLYQVLFIEGLARTRAGTAALVLAASPAFMAIIGRLRGVERPTRRGLVGIALSIGGVALVMLGAASDAGGRGAGGAGVAGADTLLGIALCLAGCACWSGFTVLLEPYTHRVHGVRLSAVTMLGGAVPLALVAAPALAATPWSETRAEAWGAVAYSGLGALVLAYLIYYRGVRVLGPTRTAMYANLQPVIALGVAWLTLGETPTLAQSAGAAAIMGGILLTRR